MKKPEENFVNPTGLQMHWKGIKNKMYNKHKNMNKNSEMKGKGGSNPSSTTKH